MNMIINANNIVKSFQISGQLKTLVLKGLDFQVQNGDFVSLVGPSGVGKSTLLYLLGTLDLPDSGDITIETNDKIHRITEMPDSELAKIRNNALGFVFQFHQLLPEFTALENVIMPALIQGKPKRDAIEKAKMLVERVGMSHRLNHKPLELSGGEQQRIAIARSLINNPQIILADEPTGNLDAANSRQVLELISELRNEFNLTCIVATHSTEVANYSDRICTMSDGKIVTDIKKN